MVVSLGIYYLLLDNILNFKEILGFKNSKEALEFPLLILFKERGTRDEHDTSLSSGRVLFRELC